MKARHIVWALVLTLAAGAAQADFTLWGDEQLTVDTIHFTGTLYDQSQADIVSGGCIFSSLSAYDSSTANVSGGYVNGLWASGSSTVNVSGGQVNGLSAYDSSTANVSDGYVANLGASDTGTANVSGGVVDDLWASGSSTVNVSGGVVDFLEAYGSSTTIFDARSFHLGSGLTLDGEHLLGTGMLSGEWFNGVNWSVDIVVNTYDATILIPIRGDTDHDGDVDFG